MKINEDCNGMLHMRIKLWQSRCSNERQLMTVSRGYYVTSHWRHRRHGCRLATDQAVTHSLTTVTVICEKQYPAWFKI